MIEKDRQRGEGWHRKKRGIRSSVGILGRRIDGERKRSRVSEIPEKMDRIHAYFD